MNFDKLDPIIAGSLNSKETTPNQDKLINILGYFAKIAKIVSDTEVVYVIEQPNGLENYLKQKEIQEKAQDEKLTRDQIEKLEKKYRFAERHKPLGNSTSILNHLLGDVLSTDKVRDIVAEAIKESQFIASKAETVKSQLDSKHDGDLI